MHTLSDLSVGASLSATLQLGDRSGSRCHLGLSGKRLGRLKDRKQRFTKVCGKDGAASRAALGI